MALQETDKQTGTTLVRTQPAALDGGYGWIVLLGSFISFFIADGWSYSFGVLFPKIIDHFEVSHGATSMVGTLLYAIPMIVSPIACALVSTYGYRIIAIVGGLTTGLSLVAAAFATSISALCIIIGLLSGIGLAMVYVSAFFAVTVYFERRRGLATSIAVAGSGIGALAFPPFIEILLDYYSWKGAILIAGGICLNLAAAGALFRPLPVDESVSRNRQHDASIVQCERFNCLKLLAHELRLLFRSMFDRVTFQSFSFLLFCLANFGLFLWISMPYVYIVDYAMFMDNTLPPWDASLLLSLSGIGRIFGQFVFGFLGDINSLSSVVLFAIGSSVAGLCTTLVPALKSYSLLGIYATAFGVSASVTTVLPMMCLVEILGLSRAVNAFGFLQLVQGVATLFGTPIAGWLFDANHGYNVSFYIAGTIMLLSGLTVFPVLYIHKRTTTNNNLYSNS